MVSCSNSAALQHSIGILTEENDQQTNKSDEYEDDDHNLTYQGNFSKFETKKTSTLADQLQSDQITPNHIMIRAAYKNKGAGGKLCSPNMNRFEVLNVKNLSTPFGGLKQFQNH